MVLDLNFKAKGYVDCVNISEAVRDEVNRGKNTNNVNRVEDAMKAHISFCGKIQLSPAIRVADGMR